MNYFDYCPTLRDLIDTKEVIGASGKPFNLLGGMSTVNNLITLRKLMLDIKPQKTLEVGMACGASTLVFVATHKDLGFPPKKQHIAIDAFQTNGFDSVGILQLEKAGLSNYLDIRESLSCYELAKLAENAEKFDMVYIDGSHQFEDVFCDFYYIAKITNINGLILFDDSSDVEVAKVIKFIKTNLADFFEYIPIYSVRSFDLRNQLKYLIGNYFQKNQLTIFRKINNGQRSRDKLLKRF